MFLSFSLLADEFLMRQHVNENTTIVYEETASGQAKQTTRKEMQNMAHSERNYSNNRTERNEEWINLIIFWEGSAQKSKSLARLP